MMAVYTILPAFVAADPAREEHGFSASPLESGLFLLPVAIAMLVGGPPAGGARRIAPINVLRLGIAAMTIALALIAFAHTERWMLYVWLGLLGLGTGACLAVLGRLAVESVRPDQSGIAGGINTLMRTVGGAVAAQASAVIVSAFALDDGTLVSRGYTYAFAFAALGGSAALVSTLALARARVGLSARFVHYQPTNRLP
jgi:MFS family permease